VPQYALGLGSYAGTDTVYSPALATESHTTVAQIQSAIETAMGSGTISNYGPNAVYMVILRAGQFAPTASCGTESQVNYIPPNGTDVVVPFGVVTSFTHSTPSYCPPPTLTPFEGQTLMFSYFLAYVVTNPGPSAGWASTAGRNIVGPCAAPASAISNLSYRGHSYDVVKYYSVQVHACLSTPLPTKLVAFAQGPTRVTASLSSNGIALPGRTIDVRTSSSVLASGVTNSAGTAFITIPHQPAGTRLVAALMNVPALNPVATLVTSR
jgi:hypothetical protein